MIALIARFELPESPGCSPSTGGSTRPMRWLLERNDRAVQGLDYLLHGGIEDGGMGAVDWRRYMHQRPHLLQFAKTQPQLPPDFDPKRYLELNPDVLAARAEPRAHYLKHGIVEGRRYK